MKIGESLTLFNPECDKLPEFLLTREGNPLIEDSRNLWVNLRVDEVVGWQNEHDPTTFELELYLSATIKADGCSHFYFGDQGYLHFCGECNFRLHMALIKKLYQIAAEIMGDKMFDDAWGEEYTF